jgi:paraquat-inducible protein B
MSEPRNPNRTEVHQSRRLPVIWAIPIMAIAIGGWLAWDTLSKEGPTIVVSFEDAEGLQIGQSQLKFKDITLGTVKSLDFTKDRRSVLVSIATTAQAEPFFTTGTQFWVVKPRLFAGIGQSLNTLTKKMSELTDSPQLQQAVTGLAGTMSEAEVVLKQLDTDMGPALKKLPAIATLLDATLKQTNQLERSVDRGYGDDTQFHRDLDRLMAQTTDAVRSFKALANLLTRHPEALLRGRPESGSQ